MILRLLPLIFIVTACALLPTGKGKGDHARYFNTQVKPVLQQHCLQCHNGSLPPPALNLATKATAFTRNASGREYILPRAPSRSLLITAVQRGGTHGKMMPRTELSLTDDQIGMLREWIEDGAYWPEGHRGYLQPEHSAENP
jgi:uncharacterized membrane protein